MRLAHISALKSVRYWSVSHQSWQPLVTDSGALDGPEGKVRPDPVASELTAGSSFTYFEVSHGRTVYRMTVLERTAERLVVSTENLTPIRIGILTAFDPGAMQSVIFLDKRGSGVWGYYQTIRATEGASTIAMGSNASYVNRLAALYRYMAGIPTDQEPPARALISVAALISPCWAPARWRGLRPPCGRPSRRPGHCCRRTRRRAPDPGWRRRYPGRS